MDTIINSIRNFLSQTEVEIADDMDNVEIIQKLIEHFVKRFNSKEGGSFHDYEDAIKYLIE